MKTNKKHKKLMKPKLVLGRNKKVDKSIAVLFEHEKKKAQLTNFRNKREDILIHTTDIKSIINIMNYMAINLKI